MYKIKVTKQDAEKFLADVPDDRAFWCCDGRVFRNITELAEGLEAMPDETFMYHSNDGKHDFSNWLNEVIEDEKLGKDLSRALTRHEAAKRVNDRVTLLNLKM